jgi:hypothetical protein
LATKVSSVVELRSMKVPGSNALPAGTNSVSVEVPARTNGPYLQSIQCYETEFMVSVETPARTNGPYLQWCEMFYIVNQ